MKIQDIAFLIVIIIIFFLKKPRWIMYMGLFCLIVSIPLFGLHIFFTAERLVYYAAGCFLIEALRMLFGKKE